MLLRTVTAMPEWLGNPALWIIAVIFVGGVIFAIGRWVESVSADQKTFKEFMTKVGSDLDEIRANIQRIFPLLPQPVVEGNSPVHLTDFGEKVSATVNASRWAEEQAAGLVETAKGKEEFEVFDICVDHVSKVFKDDPEFQKAVRSGAYQIGTDMENVLKVCHVELRDRVLGLIPH